MEFWIENGIIAGPQYIMFIPQIKTMWKPKEINELELVGPPPYLRTPATRLNTIPVYVVHF